jgi:hypothetical protein
VSILAAILMGRERKAFEVVMLFSKMHFSHLSLTAYYPNIAGAEKWGKT